MMRGRDERVKEKGRSQRRREVRRDFRSGLQGIQSTDRHRERGVAEVNHL